jgi:hypothetical protein
MAQTRRQLTFGVALPTVSPMSAIAENEQVDPPVGLMCSNFEMTSVSVVGVVFGSPAFPAARSARVILPDEKKGKLSLSKIST